MGNPYSVPLTVLPGFLLFTLGAVRTAFTVANDVEGEALYRPRQYSPEGEAASSRCGLTLAAESLAGLGTIGIVARAAANGRFYCVRNEFLAHGSEELGIANREYTLRLCEELSDHTLLSSFYIEPEYGETLAPQLMSRGRLLFVRNYPQLFAERIGAENPGLCDDEGNSPVWDALGHRFFKMPLPEAELRSGGRSKSCIAELMPRMPVYVSLLSTDAQWAMGQLHPDAELPFGILVAEGFDVDSYVDIFDGGPIAEARVAMLRSVVSALNVGLRGDVAAAETHAA